MANVYTVEFQNADGEWEDIPLRPEWRYRVFDAQIVAISYAWSLKARCRVVGRGVLDVYEPHEGRFQYRCSSLLSDRPRPR